MFYRGTGKADHGFRVSIIMDADSRFILGYSIGTYHKEKPKKGEKFSELEKAAIAMAEKTLSEYGVVDEEGNALRIVDPGKNTRCSAFFGSLAAESLLRYDYQTFDELKVLVDRYMNYYNNERIHSKLVDCGYVPVEAWKMNIEAGGQSKKE
ncbi:IS3 family transposase [Enterococcus faecium]|uniref:IS3 family transposase n=1 Tax=Enterococcus faecium TaxID=1352 RepID=UPI00296AAFC5|nr:IS3 family transposase [Enterococcus faecium]MDW3710263.1 IS3 family transposase [Enterococcus faecium]